MQLIYRFFKTKLSFSGGNMQRLFRLSFLAALLGIILSSAGYAQLPQSYVSGSITPGQVRVFQSDSVYIINKDLVVGGTLIIEPGTTVYFYNGGRLIDSVGGRIIADGYAQSNYDQTAVTNPVATYPAEQGGFGYADMRYFLYNDGTKQVLSAKTRRDVTVHPDKYNHIFNVLLDTANREIVNLQNPDNPAWPKTAYSLNPANSNQVIVPFEYAITFQAARLYLDPNTDPNLKINAWKRHSASLLAPNKNANVAIQRIRFIGQPQNNFSREWGHIIILPGARAAFFRNASFEGFKKDTTVDRFPMYTQAALPGLTGFEFQSLMKKIKDLTNGAGGAMTTMSSRTWLLNCTFTKNMARNRGGALQILQAPIGFPKYIAAVTSFYPDGKNPQVTDRDGSISEVNLAHKIPFIDNIDAPSIEPLVDSYRQAFDDARIAVYLGRVRNLKFDRNELTLANVGVKTTNTIPPVQYVTEITDEAAVYPQLYGNKAFGGALYVAGDPQAENTQMEIAFGVNDKMMIGGVEVVLDPSYYDTFEASNNKAANYQSHLSSFGARGGAVYVGAYTSVIFGGSFLNNQTKADFLIGNTTAANNGYFSMGGAIFAENSNNRIQIRGGQRDLLQVRNNIDVGSVLSNRTQFRDNNSGAGGAIFVDGNVSALMSPVIGGSDLTWNTRDYGFDVRFDKNIASSFGGAIYSKRNMIVTGAGGSKTDVQFYGGFYPIMFTNNTAGYYGGALAINIPNSFPITTEFKRTVQIVRADFEGNHVGMNVDDVNKAEIRGGGAIYSLNGDLNLVKGSLFMDNMVHNGNGGAIALINPLTSSRKIFVSDLDQVNYNLIDHKDGIAVAYTSVNAPFTYSNAPIAPDVRMLTRFLDNGIELDEEIINTQMGTGTTQIGQGTPIPSENLNATYWLDNKVGTAVGGNGKIIKFTNGGTKWEYQPSFTNVDLTDIFYTTDLVGYAVGAYNTVLKTTNAGMSWMPLAVPAITYNPQINDINFVGTDVGYAVLNNGWVLRTDDAGASWTSSRPANRDLHSIAWIGVNNGFVVGDRGLILKTTNAGMSWDVQITPGLTSDLTSIIFKSATQGYAIGKGGVIIRTTDAGMTWDFATSNTDQDLRSIYFYGQSIGFAAGASGTIVKTIDGGLTWTLLTSGTTNQLNSIYFINANEGFVAGNTGLLLGTKDGGTTWTAIRPADESLVDVKRWHQETSLPENGVGLGGAIYILDKVALDRIGRIDSVQFNRVRIQNNMAYSGSAIYSDNYDLKLILNRSLVTGNMVDERNTIGLEQNYISGPVIKDASMNTTANFASSDLAPATIYGEVQGPLPSYIFSEAANSIYGNTARFLIRLPDAPNTKGVLAGTTGIGFGGTDTLRGNYWGHTEANVIMQVDNQHGSVDLSRMETFFLDVATADELNRVYPTENYLPFLYQPTSDPRTQGPFESIGSYSYTPIPLVNGMDENTHGTNSIAEKFLFSGKIYDIYDKGTDIKTADYSKRRMSPIEDFAVGIAPIVKLYTNTQQPSNAKYVKRMMRDPFSVEMKDTNGNVKYPYLATIQGEWRPDATGRFYHPIGYPLYLESMVDYNTGLIEKTNHDSRLLNESVYFVINETTGDFIRVNMKQVDELAPYTEIFRTRVELVPDSTNRNSNSTIRRTAEGLLNLGSNGLYPFAPYSNPVLMDKLMRNPYNEDAATLSGRKYNADSSALAKIPHLFSNRPNMPDNNRTFNGATPVSNTTYFAGERYGALPVDTGDVVRVISRTVLWREGVLPAYTGGIVFKVVGSTLPPVFTGNLPKLETDTIVKIVESEFHAGKDTLKITQFLNKIFVTEDRTYPVSNGWYSMNQDPNVGVNARGRDSILTVTAIDSNKWYDPRSIIFPDKYANLSYSWWVDANSGLKRWLMVDTVKANVGKDDANGFYEFKGQPLNPYVVPGGEDLFVSVANFPPHWRSVDVLKEMGQPQDVIDQFINIFPKYISSPIYDVTNARYLQQDTIDYGYNYAASRMVKLFVVDSVPRFIEPAGVGANYGSAQVKINENSSQTETRDYVPTEYTCGKTNSGQLVANLTNALRFKVDFNTDDELEDSWALNWDFRYGKTAYGFMNIAIRGGDAADTVIVDPWTFSSDIFYGNYTAIKQIRPTWMANQFMVRYDDENIADTYGLNLIAKGQLRYSIDRTTALGLLTPDPQFNGALKTDTVFAIVANDGHGGIKEKYMDLFINVAPEIVTTDLPDATEGIDYNPTLLDSAKMVKVFDANFGQRHKFELVYSDYPEDSIAVDPCFPEAGYFPVLVKKTPKWLKINEESGLLYGKAGISDAPKNDTVTVIVWDENGLPTVKSFKLRVKSVNHPPHLTGVPEVVCIDEGEPWEAYITVTDLDLIRANSTEKLTFTLLQPADPTLLDITPGTAYGDTIKVKISTASFNLPRDPIDGKVTVKIQVKDIAGNIAVLEFRLQLSLPTDFLCPLVVENKLGANKTLVWGTAPNGATTGDGTDGNPIGTIDADLCEFEIPPYPPNDVFDARWSITSRNGLYRNIFPRAQVNQIGERIYMGRFQAGGEKAGGNVALLYPITLTWPKSTIPAINSPENPSGGSWYILDAASNGNKFAVDMRTGALRTAQSVTVEPSLPTDPDLARITILTDAIEGFIIVYDMSTGVNDNNNVTETKITSVSPNPVTSASNINFTLSNSTNVTMEVYDNLGNKVSTIIDAPYNTGIYNYEWNARDMKGTTLPSGTYTLRLVAGESVSNFPVVIVK